MTTLDPNNIVTLNAHVAYSHYAPNKMDAFTVAKVSVKQKWTQF